MRYADIKRVDGDIDRIAALEVSEFPFFQLPDHTRRAKHKKIEYMKLFATFDIETTTIQPDPEKAPEGFMYHWQMKIGGVVVYGRRWEEWLELMKKISDWLELSEERRMVVYVHNLSYEFQFIKDFLIEDFGGVDVFATGRRVPIYVSCGAGFEFRCSYKLTNMNLQMACENELGVIHPKAAGDLDFKIKRSADTYLDDLEFGYCISDVVSLYELIERRLINEGDTLDTIPLTSTGYIRRMTRAACRKDKRYRDNVFKKQIMTKEVYILLKEAGRGGNTHANRYLSNLVFPEVDSADAVSDYPAQLLLRKYPMSKFTYYGDIESEAEMRKLLREYACLFRIILKDVKVKTSVTMPYIPSAKVLYHGSGAKYDNGRVLECSWLSMTVTDLDWKIIEKQYEYSELSISDFHIAKYDYLPEPIREVVLKLYREKCELKYKIENCEDPEELEALQYYYAKCKNRLNAVFGMMFTDPVRANNTITESGEWITTVPDIDEALEHFAKSRNSFLIYAWGCWCTAWARLHLEEGALEAFGDDAIYCDTDSTKGIASPKVRRKLEKFNNNIRKLCDKLGAYCDVGGVRYYLGIFEWETKKPYKYFKTLGAKKYAYVDDRGFHITISGVNKKIGALEMEDINNFRPGFIFRDAGGKTLYYNDDKKHTIMFEGCEMLTASNIGMIDSTYELGITDEYAELIGMNVYKELT